MHPVLFYQSCKRKTSKLRLNFTANIFSNNSKVSAVTTTN